MRTQKDKFDMTLLHAKHAMPFTCRRIINHNFLLSTNGCYPTVRKAEMMGRFLGAHGVIIKDKVKLMKQ